MPSSLDTSYNLLPEQPLTSDQKMELGFGHDSIVRTLADIIQHCVSPFTIGLFGKWGTGKTTIAEHLRGTLIEQRIPTIIFDVWKHEGDAIRRTFLLEVVEQLNGMKDRGVVKKEIKVDERLQSGKSVTTHRYHFRWGRLWRHLFVFLLLSLVVAAILLLILPRFAPQIWENFTWPAVLTGVIAAITSTYIFKYIDHFVDAEKSDAKLERFQDPHEFEKEFHQVLTYVESSRILVIFDNMDRVSADVACKMIGSLKAFLEPARKGKKELIFLIPCDVQAIKSHLMKTADGIGVDKEMQAEEFLRKIFNTALWIPEFAQIDLETFTTAKLKETGISELQNDYVVWLIMKVFAQNIRQIVQFINILVTNYLMLKNSQDKELARIEFYKNNVPQLAKYLLMLQRFPAFVDFFKANAIYDIEAEGYHAGKLEALPDQERFLKFMRETDQVKIDSLEPFLMNKISHNEERMSGITAWLIELTSNEFKLARTRLETFRLEDAEKKEAFSEIISSYIRKLNAVTLPIFFNNLMKVLSWKKIRLKPTTYLEMENALNEVAINGKVSAVDPAALEQLYECFTVANTQKRRIIYSAQIHVAQELLFAPKVLTAEENSYLTNLMGSIRRGHLEYMAAGMGKLKGALEENGIRYPALVAMLTEEPAVFNQLLDTKFVAKLIESLSLNDFLRPDKLGTERIRLLETVPMNERKEELLLLVQQMITAFVKDANLRTSPLIPFEADRILVGMSNILLRLVNTGGELRLNANAMAGVGALYRFVERHQGRIEYLLPYCMTDQSNPEFSAVQQKITREICEKLVAQSTPIGEFQLLLEILKTTPNFFTNTRFATLHQKILRDDKLYPLFRTFIPKEQKVTLIESLIDHQELEEAVGILSLDGESLANAGLQKYVATKLLEATEEKLIIGYAKVFRKCWATKQERRDNLLMLLKRKRTAQDKLYFEQLKSSIDYKADVRSNILNELIKLALQDPSNRHNNVIEFISFHYKEVLDPILLMQLITRFTSKTNDLHLLRDFQYGRIYQNLIKTNIGEEPPAEAKKFVKNIYKDGRLNPFKITMHEGGEYKDNPVQKKPVYINRPPNIIPPE
ncbi:MAG: P-loop NTPase fold protein [Chitinophagaceae bacterium]